MEQTDYTCKDCVLLNDEDYEFPYCMGKNSYTYVNPDDDACGDIIPLVYIRARIVSSLRMKLVTTLMRLGLLLRRILLAQISSIRK